MTGKHLSIVFCLLLCIFPNIVNAQKAHLSVTEFRKLDPSTGIYKILGYVAKHYECPPCPSRAQCKPCMGNNVLISEEREIIPNYPDTGSYLVVLTEHPKELLLGQSYLLTVEVLNAETTAFGVRDLQLKSAVEQSSAVDSRAQAPSNHRLKPLYRHEIND